MIFCLAFGFYFQQLYAQVQHLEVTAKDAAGKLQNITPKDTASGWKLDGITGINFGQAALVNWSAGGENTISGNFYLNGSLDYTKEKWSLDNDLVLNYGLIYSDENRWRKNADKISLSSKLGYKINKHWHYAFMIDFNSQFAKGYNYPNTVDYISTFMAPAYFNAALGFNYKPNEHYSLFISPITARTTFVLDDTLSHQGAFGMDIDQKIKVEPGAYLVATAKQNVMQNVDIISKLDMFTPYNSDFGNVDINWDLLVSFKINKLFTATLNTTLRYYDREHYIELINGEKIDRGPKIQFKEIFGIGFAYNF